MDADVDRRRAPGWPGWSPPPSWPTPAGGCCWSTRSPSEPRRPGVLVVRRAVPRRLARAAPDGHQGLPRAGLAGLAGQRRLRPRPRGPLAARAGRRRTSTSRPGRSGPGCTRMGHCGGSRSWAGPSGAAAAADGHGNSVPRFHVTWGTGPGVVEPFERRVREAVGAGPGRRCAFRHRVDGLVVDRRRGRPGYAGRVLEPERRRARHAPATATVVGDFELTRAGGDRHLRRHRRQPRPGPRGLAGAARHPAGPDGRRGARARRRPDARHHRDAPAGSVINPDRMWHYIEGIRNWDPIWAEPRHPDPARAVLAVVRRARAGGCPRRYFPGFDTLGTLRHLRAHRPRLLVVRAHPEDHREGVRAVRLRAEPRPDRQGRPAAAGAGPAGRARAGRGVQAARRGLRRGRHPAGAGRRDEQARPDDGRCSTRPRCARQVEARDREIDNPFTKDVQLTAIRGARALPRRPARSGSRRRTRCSTRRPGR